jgi:hypothetical protein
MGSVETPMKESLAPSFIVSAEWTPKIQPVFEYAINTEAI